MCFEKDLYTSMFNFAVSNSSRVIPCTRWMSWLPLRWSRDFISPFFTSLKKCSCVIPNKVSVRVPGIILLPGLFLFLGCTTSSPPSPTTSSKYESGNFLAIGKVLFRQPDQKQSGDLELRYSDPGRFQLKIFTPLVGSLIYELRADKQQLMVLDYHNEWFVLKANDADCLLYTSPSPRD